MSWPGILSNVAAASRMPPTTGVWYRTQECNDPDICCGKRAFGGDQRSNRHDLAIVYSIRNHAWLHLHLRIPGSACSDIVALHGWQSDGRSRYTLLPDASASRIATLASPQSTTAGKWQLPQPFAYHRAVRQSLPRVASTSTHKTSSGKRSLHHRHLAANGSTSIGSIGLTSIVHKFARRSSGLGPKVPAEKMVSRYLYTIQGPKMSSSHVVWPDRLVSTAAVWCQCLRVLLQLGFQGFIDREPESGPHCAWGTKPRKYTVCLC